MGILVTESVKVYKLSRRIYFMVVVTKINLRKRELGVLSPLEHDVLKILWKTPDGLRVRDVYNRLRKRRKIVLTSAAVILDRRHKKQFAASKVHDGPAGDYYVYYQALSQADFQKSLIDETVNRFIERFGPIAVNYFSERFSSKKKGHRHG